MLLEFQERIDGQIYCECVSQKRNMAMEALYNATTAPLVLRRCSSHVCVKDIIHYTSDFAGRRPLDSGTTISNLGLPATLYCFTSSWHVVLIPC